MDFNFWLVLTGGLISTLLALIAYIGNGMIEQLKNITTSLNAIEKELGVLSNDHANLKESVHDIKERVLKLEAE